MKLSGRATRSSYQDARSYRSMARPVSAGSLSRRYRQEAALVRRRNAEQEHMELWNNVSRYFHSNEVQCSKHEVWTSPRLLSSAEEARAKAAEARERAHKLQCRREKLSKLLLEEAMQTEVALKQLGRQRWVAPQVEPPLEKLREVNLELKLREEEKRRQQAELMLYHRWRQQQPSITEYERRLHGKFVREAWAEQCHRRQTEEKERQRQEYEEAMKQREERAREEERLKQEEADKRQRKIRELQEQLEKQMQELRDQETQSEELRREAAKVIQRRVQLEEAMEQRRRIEERRRKQELGNFLHRQYQLKLRRRALEVQEALAEDLEMVTTLMASLAEDKLREDEQRNRARMEMESVRRELEEQARLEKERERQLAFLFYEEARRMWDQQEARWRADQEARNQLMAQVLATQQQQIAEKLERNRERQSALLRSREELLLRVEAADKELEEERAAEEMSKERCKLEIGRQVVQKERRRLEETRKEQEEAERQREQLRREEERIQEELRRLEQRGYHPRNVGRRRILW